MCFWQSRTYELFCFQAKIQEECCVQVLLLYSYEAKKGHWLKGIHTACIISAACELNEWINSFPEVCH